RGEMFVGGANRHGGGLGDGFAERPHRQALRAKALLTAALTWLLAHELAVLLARRLRRRLLKPARERGNHTLIAHAPCPVVLRPFLAPLDRYLPTTKSVEDHVLLGLAELFPGDVEIDAACLGHRVGDAEYPAFPPGHRRRPRRDGPLAYRQSG